MSTMVVPVHQPWSFSNNPACAVMSLNLKFPSFRYSRFWADVGGKENIRQPVIVDVTNAHATTAVKIGISEDIKLVGLGDVVAECYARGLGFLDLEKRGIFKIKIIAATDRHEQKYCTYLMPASK